jgi:hypothetical protein
VEVIFTKEKISLSDSVEFKKCKKLFIVLCDREKLWKGIKKKLGYKKKQQKKLPTSKYVPLLFF